MARSLLARAVPAVAGAATVLVYLLRLQTSYWSDGRFLLRLVERGATEYHHALYLAAARAAARLGAAFGADVETSLLLLSALSGAGAAALVAAAVERLWQRPWLSLVSALAFAFSPLALFYSTSIEVHGLHLLAAAIAAHRAAVWRTASESPHAVEVALVLALVVATHTSGALLAPAAFAALFLATGSPRRPRGLRFAGLATVAIGTLWLTLAPNSISWGRIAAAAGSVTYRWNAAFVVEEFLWRAGALALLPLAVVFVRRDLARTDVALASLAALPFLVVLPAYQVGERGAYFVSLLPFLALASAAALVRIAEARRPALLGALALALPLQLGAALAQHHAWNQAYRGATWSREFVAEAAPDGLLLALDPWEAFAVSKHSKLDALSLRIEQRRREIELPASDPTFRRAAELLLTAAHARGARIGVTRTLLEHAEERPALADLLAGLERRFGALAVTRREEYLMFPVNAAAPPAEPAAGLGVMAAAR